VTNKRFKLTAWMLAAAMVLMLFSSLSVTAEEQTADPFIERIAQHRIIVRQRAYQENPVGYAEVMIRDSWWPTTRIAALFATYDETPTDGSFDFTFIRGSGNLLDEQGGNLLPASEALTFPSYTEDVFLDGGFGSLTSQVLANFTELKRIFIPDGTTDIAEDAFAEGVTPTVYGFDGSVAQTYAQAKGWEFVAIPDISGDMNIDFAVNMKDVRLLRFAIAHGFWDSYEYWRPAAGDVDGDGSLTMKDVLVLRRRIANLPDDFVPSHMK